ncbi:MAG: hypothetical protein ACU0CA_17595 [Paracoccaceae bacterium]
MNNLLEKARSGRTNALAGITANMGHTAPDYGVSERTGTLPQIDPIPFISKRAQTPNSSTTWLH